MASLCIVKKYKICVCVFVYVCVLFVCDSSDGGVFEHAISPNNLKTEKQSPNFLFMEWMTNGGGLWVAVGPGS